MSFNKATECMSCRKVFDQEKCSKEMNICPFTNTYVGAICKGCRYQRIVKCQTLPVIFHNFRGYDGHIILKHGIEKMKHWKLSVIAQTNEKFMTLRADVPVSTRKDLSLTYFQLVFLDSFQFMASSLSALVQNLKSIPITQHLKEEYPLLHDETLNRKGVFPYSYLNSLERLNETCLPSIEAFTNDLSGAKCSESDYEHAQKA